MSAKDLEAEFITLKDEFSNLNTKIDNLIQKYTKLEKKYEKCVTKKKKVSFICNTCCVELENLEELRKHKEEHNDSSQGDYQCEECDKYFKDGDQLEVHMRRVHRKYECDECDKVFKNEWILIKHKEATHEGVELFCHYYNNGKDCPFDDECIFMHEESESCKYGEACDRVMCMYKHEVNNDNENEDDEEDESDDEENLEEVKPSIEGVRKSLEKVAALLKQVVPNFKCNHCEFEAKNQNGLNMHMKSKHTNKS